MFHFFVILSFVSTIIMIIFAIIYINKLETKIDSLIDTFDEMDIIDASAIEKRKFLNMKKNENRYRKRQ